MLEREHAASAQLASTRLQGNALQARAHAETTMLAAEVRGASLYLFAQTCRYPIDLCIGFCHKSLLWSTPTWSFRRAVRFCEGFAKRHHSLLHTLHSWAEKQL